MDDSKSERVRTTQTASKCRRPFHLTVEWLVSTSDLHFESMAASFSFASTDKEQNMAQRSNYVPQQAEILPQRSNLLPQRENTFPVFSF